MEKRKLVYLRPASAPSEFQLESLLPNHELQSLDLARTPASRIAHYPVGLVTVTAGTPIDPLESLLATPVEWVALVAADALEQRQLRRLIHSCCSDYLLYPLSPERLSASIQHAERMAGLRDDGAREGGGECRMVGRSLLMRRLLRMLDLAAVADEPVLIHGESGTGKKLAAMTLHERSPRADGPFVVVNCGALPAGLLQSELFGDATGVLNGASQRKIGRIEAAAGGTLFLDEIGELPLALQVDLLRFLQERTIKPVGCGRPIPVDVRVLAATHVDLEAAVAQQRFRADLYYRLNVLRLEVPALRHRHGDVELLAGFVFDAFRGEKAPRVKGFSRQALAVMNRYAWPGNVRELVNRVRRAMATCEGRLIMPADLGLEHEPGLAVHTLAEARAVAEREAVERALLWTGGNVSRAAGQLGVSRVTLYRLIERYQVRAPEAAPRAPARPEPGVCPGKAARGAADRCGPVH